MDLWSRLLARSIISCRLSTASCRGVPYVGSWEPVPSRHGQCPRMKSRLSGGWFLPPLTEKPQKEQKYVTSDLSHGCRRRTTRFDRAAYRQSHPPSLRSALQNVKRAFFTYPVADGLLEAATIFANAARDAGTELVVNNSQFQNRPEAPSFRNLQHRLADRIFNWAQVGAVHLQAPPYYENLRALVARSVSEQGTVFLPWGTGALCFH